MTTDSFANVKLKLTIKHALETLQVEIQEREGSHKRPPLSDVVQHLLDTYKALPRSKTELLPRNDNEKDLVQHLLRLCRNEHTPEQLKRAVDALLSA